MSEYDDLIDVLRAPVAEAARLLAEVRERSIALHPTAGIPIYVTAEQVDRLSALLGPTGGNDATNDA